MPENFLVFGKFVWIAIKNCTKDTVTTFEIDKSILSQVFEVPIGGEITKWYLGLYPNDESNPSGTGLYLFRKDELKLQFTVNYTFYIIGKSGKHAECSFRYSSNEFHGRGQGAHQFLSHAKFVESFDELIIDGNFEVCCELTISALDSKPSSSPTIFKNIQRMYDDELLKDFELRCNDDQKLQCHKFILASQSPVFYAMLTNDMKEINQGFAEVPDFDSVVMKEVLRFIYCFSAENLDNIAEKLIFAAEKYDLDDLKQKCIENIAKKLSKDNVIQALLISDKVSGCEKLFQKCIAVVVGNLSEITKTPDWAGLSNGILTKIVNFTAKMISSVKAERIN